jgi:hypothetical protein
MDIPEVIEQYTQYILTLNTPEKTDLITLHQAIYRLFAFEREDWAVLHASGVVVDKKSVLFADDGISVGKTTQTLYLYKRMLAAGRCAKLIGDEFILYKNGYLYANRYYPIHNKPSAKGLIENLFGKFIEYYLPQVNEYIEKPVKLESIVCPHLNCPTSYLQEVTDPLAFQEILKATFFAHEAKLVNPALDRYSIFTNSREDGVSIKDVREYTRLKRNLSVAPNIRVYVLHLNTIEDLVPILKKADII